MMTENTKAAFDELTKIGASVLEWDMEDEPHIAFHISGETNEGEPLFVDFRCREIQERYEDGRVINPQGVRQDVHEILRKYHLVTDWHDSAMIVVYNDPYAAGQHHDNYFSAHMLGDIGRSIFQPFGAEPPKSMDEHRLREMVLEQCERMRKTHPHHERFWNQLSTDEKSLRLEEAIPSGTYPETWDELDMHLKQFRK